MSRARQILLLIALIILLLIIFTLYGCQTIPLIPPADPLQPLDIQTGATTQQVALDPELPYVPNQIIIAGEPDDVLRLLQDERLAPLQLRPVDQIGLNPNDPKQQQPPEPGAAALEPIPAQGYLLAEIGSGEIDVPAAQALIVEAVIALNAASPEPVVALPSPNYLVANPWVIDAVPWVIDAVPWVIDAVPWVIDAVPWVIDAVPWVIDAVPAYDEPLTGDGIVTPFIPQELVRGPWQQWALIGPDSIDLYEMPGPRRTVEQTGRGVDVFIFDTSPYDSIPAGSRAVVDLLGRELAVYHPALPIEIPAGPGQIKEHGAFAAGEIRLVAPNGRFHLVRALNADGRGDIFSFIAVLEAAGRARGSWDGAVINLSMSLRGLDDLPPAAAEELKLTPEQSAALKAALPAGYHPLLDDPIPVPALFVALLRTHLQGGLVVGAVGNGSDLPQGIDRPTGIPARWPFVVATAGHNAAADRACFSNRPEPGAVLFAPSGDGADDGRPPSPSCDYPLPAADDTGGFSCPGVVSGYDCRFTLVGVPSSYQAGNPEQMQFLHWIGTSFAAPLTSGTAVLLTAEAAALDCDLTPTDLKAALTTGERLNVPAALAAVQTKCGE